MPRLISCVLFFALWVSACTQTQPLPTPSLYDPFVPLDGATPIVIAVEPTRTPGPTPTRAPLSVTLPAPRNPNSPILTPTPDAPRALPTARAEDNYYLVQPGDTLGTIAQAFGVSLEALAQANGLANPDVLDVGQQLVIPPPDPAPPGPDFKIIPDSELVYGPAGATFDVQAFILQKGGYLVSYTEDVDGETLSGAEILTRVAQNYSVNPRLLLAVLQHQSDWVSNPNPDPATFSFPLGRFDPWHEGLYLQLTWAANELNRGYYLWRANAVSNWVLADGSAVAVAPTINAGSAGVQNLFAGLDDRAAWEADVTEFGLFQTYFFLFGNPFDLAIEPLLPPGLGQPRMELPFESGVIWSFTGGPHGAWDSGSAWAALDFGPPLEEAGCTPSDAWVTAVAAGWIVRTGDGVVIQDLDGDGYEQTGWSVFYMHVESRERVQPGAYLYAGDRIGHPSCEGGLSNGTHVHIARKYNGEWIPADGPLPFTLSGWVSSGAGVEYDGYLTRGVERVEAWEEKNELNQIGR